LVLRDEAKRNCCVAETHAMRTRIGEDLIDLFWAQRNLGAQDAADQPLRHDGVARRSGRAACPLIGVAGLEPRNHSRNQTHVDWRRCGVHS